MQYAPYVMNDKMKLPLTEYAASHTDLVAV